MLRDGCAEIHVGDRRPARPTAEIEVRGGIDGGQVAVVDGRPRAGERHAGRTPNLRTQAHVRAHVVRRRRPVGREPEEALGRAEVERAALPGERRVGAGRGRVDDDRRRTSRLAADRERDAVGERERRAALDQEAADLFAFRKRHVRRDADDVRHARRREVVRRRRERLEAVHRVIREEVGLAAAVTPDDPRLDKPAVLHGRRAGERHLFRPAERPRLGLDRQRALEATPERPERQRRRGTCRVAHDERGAGPRRERMACGQTGRDVATRERPVEDLARERRVTRREREVRRRVRRHEDIADLDLRKIGDRLVDADLARAPEREPIAARAANRQAVVARAVAVAVVRRVGVFGIPLRHIVTLPRIPRRTQIVDADERVVADIRDLARALHRHADSAEVEAAQPDARPVDVDLPGAVGRTALVRHVETRDATVRRQGALHPVGVPRAAPGIPRAVLRRGRRHQRATRRQSQSEQAVSAANMNFA